MSELKGTSSRIGSPARFGISVKEYKHKLMPEEQHSHYKKDVSHLKMIDVYRVIQLFNVTDPCQQHALVLESQA